MFKSFKAGAAGSLVSMFTGGVLNKFIEAKGSAAIDVCKKVFRESVKGGLSTAASKAVLNYEEGKKADKDLLENVLFTALVNGTLTAADFYNMLNNPESDMNKILQEITRAKKLTENMDWFSKKFSYFEYEGMIKNSKGYKSIQIRIDCYRNDPQIMNTLGISGPSGTGEHHSLAEWERAFQILREQQSRWSQTVALEIMFSWYNRSPAVAPSIVDLEREKLRNLFKSSEITRDNFFDCSYRDLIDHVVLVHALPLDPIYNILPEEKQMEMIALSLEDRIVYCLKHAITPEGIFGFHLDFKNREFSGNLVRRPHVHWFWNQLVQANAGGNWEESNIAILEPLSTLEESINQKPFGLAAYDTFCFGPHQLSEKARILVPETIIEKAKKAFPKYKDQFIGYKPEKVLRMGVMEALKSNFPKTWHVCDEKGELLGEKPETTTNGFRSCTYLKRDDGKIILLFKNSGKEKADQSSTAVQDMLKLGKFVGLHNNSVTYAVDELNKHPYFNTLSEFKLNPKSICGNPLFAGSIPPEKLGNMGALSALELYQGLLDYDPATGVQAVADYYINELCTLILQPHI